MVSMAVRGSLRTLTVLSTGNSSTLLRPALTAVHVQSNFAVAGSPTLCTHSTVRWRHTSGYQQRSPASLPSLTTKQQLPIHSISTNIRSLSSGPPPQKPAAKHGRIMAYIQEMFPTIYKILMLLKNGFIHFYGDSKTFFHVRKQLKSGKTLGDFKRKELEVYLEWPDHVVRLIPLTIAFCLGEVFAVPLVYFFPRQCLTYHFWTEAQMEKFPLWYHKRCVAEYPFVLQQIESQKDSITNEAEREGLQVVLDALQSDKHPTVEDISRVRPLFERGPFGFHNLTRQHRGHLRKATLLSMFKSRQKRTATLLLYVDKAMAQEGVQTLDDTELDVCCLWRGLNPVGLDKEKKQEYLKEWLSISTTLTEESLSLELHLGILLSYNQASNKSLLKEMD